MYAAFVSKRRREQGVESTLWTTSCGCSREPPAIHVACIVKHGACCKDDGLSSRNFAAGVCTVKVFIFSELL